MRQPHPPRARSIAVIAASSAVMLVAACGNATQDKSHPSSSPHIVEGGPRDGYNGTLVPDPPLELPGGTFHDTSGKTVTFASRPDTGVTVLFFGFTHCDDVCPTTMADLAAAKRRLPDTASRQVRVVFITVDPARDSRPVLRRWLDKFDSSFVGLRAPRRVVHAAERSLYAPVSDIAKPAPPDHHNATDHEQHGSEDYEVNHTGSVYAFGPGDKSVLYTGATTPAEYFADFLRLLHGS